MSNDITIYDFGSICRTCLDGEDLKPLYEKCSGTIRIVEMLMSCTFLKFTEDDGLPVNICSNCIDEIKQAFSFVKRCETTDTILRKCIYKCKTELANNSSESLTVVAKEEIKIKAEVVLPNIHRTEQDVLEEVKQEVDLQHNLQIEYVEVKNEEELIIENEYDENCNDPEDESYEEDDAEDYDHKTDVKGFNISPPNSLGQQKNAQHSELNDRMYPCQICDKSFKRLVLMQAHQRIHKGEKNDNEYEETYDDPWDQNYEEDVDEDQDETYSEKSDNPPSTTQIEEESSQEEDVSSQIKKLDLVKKNEKLPNQILSRNFKCTICHRAFAEKRCLKQHSEVHKEKKFGCSACGKRFRSKYSLNFHLKDLTGAGTLHVCNVCGKSFSTLACFKNHKHKGEKQHSCSFCAKTFNRFANLQYHMRIHTGEKPFTCTVCGKSFSLNSSFIRHQKIHTREKLNVCSTCNKTFTELNNLKRHMRIHSGEKPYSCEVCSKSFSFNGDLTYHKLIHTGEKQYVCSVCNKAFRLPGHLKVHMRIHTTARDKPHTCRVCVKGFTHRTSLKRHMRIHVGECPTRVSPRNPI